MDVPTNLQQLRDALVCSMPTTGPKQPLFVWTEPMQSSQCKYPWLWPWWGRKTPPANKNPHAFQLTNQPQRQSKMLTPLIAISPWQMTEKCGNVSNISQLRNVASIARGLHSWQSLDIGTIKEQQDADQELWQTATKYADRYPRKSVWGVNDVLCYVKPGDPPSNWRMALPASMLQLTLWWVLSDYRPPRQ